MVINKKASKVYKFVKVPLAGIVFVEVIFIRTTFVGMVFVVPIISWHITTKSPIILLIYLPFSQLYVAGLQI